MSQQYVIVFRSTGKALSLNSLTKLGDQVLCQTAKKILVGQSCGKINQKILFLLDEPKAGSMRVK